MEEVEWKDKEMGKDLETLPTSWSLQGTTRLNQFYFEFCRMEKQDKKSENNEVLKSTLDYFIKTEECNQKTISLIIRRIKTQSAWNTALYGGLMVTVGMVFYQSFRLAVIEHNIRTARYYAIVTALIVPYGILQFYRAGKDLRKAEDEYLSFKKSTDEN